jgi:hypothetical protein
MPLVQGSSAKAVSENIAIERHAGRPEAQAVAIAERTADKYRHDRLDAILAACDGLVKRWDAFVTGATV